MSYVRSDDQYKRLTEFRERLEQEVRMQIGEAFPIFQDRNDIHWGQNWRDRIEGSLDEVTFLIPIITPSFFNSSPCREELELFLKREKELKRNDLILPVYYVDCPLLNDKEKRACDELAQVIAERQRADWRDLRFEPYTSPHVGKTLAQLAVQIRETLERVRGPEKTARPPSKRRAARRRTRGPSSSTAERAEAAAQVDKPRRGPSVVAEPPTRVVDPMHRGDHPTITDAIEAANPGDRILVRPGLYEEGLVIDKPLEIIGEGDPGEVVVQATGEDAVLFQANMGRVANLTLRQMGDGEWFGVDIAQGRLELEDCDITSQSLACVAIHGGADPRLRRNRIHDGNQDGVFAYENARGTLEDNDIFGNGLGEVAISDGGNPILRRNRIHDGKQSGIHVYENGHGTLEDNQIFGNAYSGVEIKEGGNPDLRRNWIHDNRQNGLLVWKKGEGIAEDNDITANGLCGVEIREGGAPTLRGNRINKNAHEGVWVDDGGGGTFEDNDLTGNAKGAWDIAKGCVRKVKRSGNKE